MTEAADDIGKARFLAEIYSHKVGTNVDRGRQNDAAEILFLDGDRYDLSAGEKLHRELVADPAVGSGLDGERRDRLLRGMPDPALLSIVHTRPRKRSYFTAALIGCLLLGAAIFAGWALDYLLKPLG